MYTVRSKQTKIIRLQEKRLKYINNFSSNRFLRKSKTHHMDKYIRMNIIYTSALFDILIWNSISNSLPDRQLLLSLLLNDKC